jgi:hypothetical protein
VDSSRTKPPGVPVIAWGSIVFGTLMALSGSMGALVSSTVLSGAQMPSGPAFPAPVEFVFRHFLAFAIIQVGVAAGLIAAGLALMRMRRWGALVIQAVSLLGLIYLVAFTAIFIRQMLTMGVRLGHHPAQTGMTVFMAGAAVIPALMWGLPLVLTLRYLRRSDVQSSLT